MLLDGLKMGDFFEVLLIEDVRLKLGLDKCVLNKYNIDMIKGNLLKRYNYHLTILQHKKLEELSQKTGNSVASIIRHAVDDYFKKLDRRKQS
jgi:hypothetical protein